MLEGRRILSGGGIHFDIGRLSATPLEISYVLPLKWSRECDREELTTYLTGLREHCAEIIVVDGSAAEDFQANANAWRDLLLHVPPDSDLSFVMGKVNGVTTGLRRATYEKVVIADDDVRYERSALESVSGLLDDFDLVRPQNYFTVPMPWHAQWDTARTLINRATSADFPGTLGVRRSTFHEVGGYDGDLIFENLELIRTVAASGGRIISAPDIYVARLPSTTGRFFSQRVRQAYDDFALPGRMAVWLSTAPVVALLGRRNKAVPLALVATSAAVAEAGRRRAGGTQYFPATASLFAPLWLLERSVCAWLAVARYLTGGVPYAGGKIRRSATPLKVLARQSRGGPS